MNQWEYLRILCDDGLEKRLREFNETLGLPTAEMISIETRLNQLGQQGWEMISVEQGWIYLKRPIE